MHGLLSDFDGLKRTAETLGIGESTLRRRVLQVEQGKLSPSATPRFSKYNGRYIFRRSDVLSWFVLQLERGSARNSYSR